MFKGHIAPIAGAPMQSVDSVETIAGRGLRGDRYFEGIGHRSSSPGVSRDVTLVEIESIDALGREKNPLGPEALAELAGSGLRRNLVTRGVPLNHLVGVEFQVGELRLRDERHPQSGRCGLALCVGTDNCCSATVHSGESHSYAASTLIRHGPVHCPLHLGVAALP